MLTAHNTLENKTGLLMYGLLGRAEIPFLGGTLCVAPPLRRTPVQFTSAVLGGGPPGCSGAMTFDFTSWLQAGTDPFLAPGVQVNAQYRYRDPAATFGAAFTNAIEFTIEP